MQLPADDALRRQFERDGFLVLPGYVSAAECAALRTRARQLLARELPGLRPSIFSTESHAHASDVYFAESGDKIRLFFEPGGLDGEGRPVRDAWQCLNKIGHALHDLDSLFDTFSRSDRNAALSRALGIEHALLVQSMYLCKQPELGSTVDWHQDASFLITEPASVIGLWFALEDATVDNGCLYAIPGAHHEPLRKRFSRRDGRLQLCQVDDTPLAIEQAIPLQAPAGTLVVLHGQLPHSSGPNRSTRSREAYSVHLTDAAASWAPDNWIAWPTTRPFRGFDDARQEPGEQR